MFSDIDVKMNPFLTKHEDLIWAIRQSTENKQESKGPEIHPAASMMQFHKDTQLQLLGTLIPDEVLLNVNNFNPCQFNGAILYGTISGLPKISDIYNQPMKGGPIQFTKVLNDYFGAVIEEILSYEGDILHLSGDSFMALWRSSDGSPPSDEVHIAINSALSIQKHCGKFEAAEVEIKMKMTITAGVLVFSLIGDDQSAHYICIGRPMDDLIEAQQKCNEDELIVAPSAWMYVKLAEFNVLETEDGAHFKVIGIGPNWHLTRKDYTMKRLSEGFDIPHALLSDEELEYEEMNQNAVTSNLRPILRLASGIQSELRKFINVQVLDFLEEEEPLERLIEMRYVVVVYINIVIKKCSLRATVDIVDRCYKFIDRNARQHKGFILRVSLLNKDIKFVVIFGLRGYTNISECRQALKCAVLCQQNLYSIEYVQAVSIACTSGSSYCGIFGHTWRKKYDVMGAFIHKATQMLMTYPDRITCDRKMFLNSQLEATNFVLMDYKKLDGVVNQGLIYEYSEAPNEDSYGSTILLPLNVHINCPILGRDHELKTFIELFSTFVQHFRECRTKNAMIIEGYPKQGKTRLLTEFVDKAIDIQRCELILTKQDFLDIYGSVRKFMEPFLKIESHASEYYKKKILKQLLPNSETDKFICSLNGVFKVNFPTTENYERLTDDEKTQELERRIHSLCKKCFIKPTLISIDNVDLMDEDSWKLLPTMLKTKTFFLVAVFNRQKRQVNRLKAFSKLPEVLRMPLKKIPKMCQAAVACQILGVYAVSADLENAIQNHSNGSPGWIENFVVTLLQAKKIYIKTMDFKKIHACGLVAPPLYMLRKLTNSQINRYKSLLEEKDEHKFDQWNVFIDSCRDEYTNVDLKNQIHKILCTDTELRVCCLTKTFNVSLDVDPEISDEMSILELYDGMSYQEQQMLSCASVLGDLFTRSFLCFMWSPESPLQACKVIQSLFEKGVLCCARGDFSSGGDYILQREYMTDPIKDKTIECYCIGMDMDDSCIFLPTYASCGYMRFRSTKLRMIIYGLIPDNQRREMHVKAAKYIQKETKRCVSCGTAYFPEKQVCRLDMTPIQRLSGKSSKKKKTNQLEQMNFEELFDYANVRSGGGSGSRDARQSVIPSLRASSVMKSYVGSLTVSGIVEDYQSHHAKTPGIITPFTIHRLKDCPSLVRTFSKSNFVTCECHLILSHMHKRLKYHYKEAGNWNRMIRSCISLAKLSVISKNYTTAAKTIEEAKEVLRNKECLMKEPKWKIDMYLGILHSLSGRVLMCYDQIDEAYEKFLEAMKTFRVPFPVKKRNVNFYFKLLRQKWAQKMSLYFLPRVMVEDGDENEFQVMNCMSDSLCHLCKIFIQRKEWKLAELAANWSLKNSLQTETSLLRICDSFHLMILISEHYRNRLLSISLEVHALRYCHKKTNVVSVNELKSVARLYRIIFEARVARAEFDAALRISYIALNIASCSNEIDTGIHILTLLPMLLLRKMHIREMISMMHELEYFANELDDIWGRLWYYSLCVIFNLETGYTFLPFNAVESFYTVEAEKLSTKKYIAKAMLMVMMWLWYIRNNYWEAASIFDKDVSNLMNYQIMNNKYACGCIYVLEGKLLSLVNKINKRSISGKAKVKKDVKRLFKKLHKAKSFAPTITSRLYHLEAYYAFIIKNEDKMKKMIQKARTSSIKLGLDLEIVHMDHSEKSWNKEISTVVRDFWKNHCSSSTCISYNDIDFENVKIYSFSYPAPIFKN
ncbi:hypothetical protein WA026_011146 [Henosepilachna vigintioctopunctata]|uniref:Guanylate cyclase domain-containing protein n=1 Tax=Henosepilachna vigintioctopunctata TaxID=420089 RepID=A0AAW1U7W1_9CUCU